jgi:hypothetical protein
LWQQIQPYVVVGALVALVIIGIIARRWTRNFARRAQEGAARGATFDKAGHGFIDKGIASLGAVVVFPVPLDQVTPLLSGMKLPMFWKADGDQRWIVTGTDGTGEPGAIAVLEATETGSRLALIRGQDMTGMPMSDKDWAKLRAAAIKTAGASGVSAQEEQGPPLVRTPLTDLTGMPPAAQAQAKHAWLRPDLAN